MGRAPDSERSAARAGDRSKKPKAPTQTKEKAPGASAGSAFLMACSSSSILGSVPSLDAQISSATASLAATKPGDTTTYDITQADVDWDVMGNLVTHAEKKKEVKNSFNYEMNLSMGNGN